MLRTLAAIAALVLAPATGPQPTHFTITDAENGIYNMHAPLLAGEN